MFEMNIGFLITGRLKSRRLPRKVILEVAGRPLISHMFDRIKQAKRIKKIVLCTSINPEDDPLEHIADTEGVLCYRGSEQDVLKRLYEASVKYQLDYIVNITADCPLIDPLLIDRIVELYEITGADLITIPKLPLGQGPNGIKVSALEKVCQIKNETDTEVWGGYFTLSGLFKVYESDVDKKYQHPLLKTSIDYPEDYEFIKAIFNRLYMPGKIFTLKDIIDLVRAEPELVVINAHCAQLGREHIRNTAVSAEFKR